jgi:isopentenyl diphosphate isomerase/L-lactate dehydrogenase-like FMN-dependent dehydrogenase
MTKKFDFKDITIVPETISSINTRSLIDIFTSDGKLPLFVSPMDTVVDEDNFDLFLKEKLEVCLPRGVHGGKTFSSVSLDEFEKMLSWYEEEDFSKDEINILVDIANGHMVKLYELSKKFTEIRKSSKHRLIVGNIANPKTYEKFAEIGVDFIRVGIGGGSGCLTSANTGVHYPMASLINECYQIKKNGNYETKIIADGGFRNYDDIIKALALGADYVMLGGVLNKTLESCSQTKLFNRFKLSKEQSEFVWSNFPKLRKHLYKEFRGMSTKEVQRKWGKQKLTTSEGIVKTNKVEYTLSSWVDNFKDYLKSSMSYTNSKNLEEFKGSEFIFITENALRRFNK